jgi:DNA polymerase
MIFLDFETRSRADLREVGAYRYAEDPSTEAICVALAEENDGVVLVQDPTPEGLARQFDGQILVAHNAEFEREILRNKFGLDIPLDRWIDTAARAARMSLPRALEDLAEFFGLDTEAKKTGGRAILELSRPNKRGEFWTREEKPQAFADLEARCIQDVELTRTIFKKLLPLDERERKIWNLTLEMNARGVKVDLNSIPAAKAVLDTDAAPQIVEFEKLTGCKVKSYVKVAQSLGLSDCRKPTVRKCLRDPSTPPRVRRALEIFQALSKSSVAKLDAMVARACHDGRVKGSFLYCGAERTGRWSSNGVQFQNFKRGLGKETDAAFCALAGGVIDEVFTGMERDHPDPPLTPTGTISEMLRGFILGPFRIGDFAQIEARVLAWLAGQHDLLKLFAEKGDPYKRLASKIYNVPFEQVTKAQRFMGKQGTLGCGYGLGGGGFQFMLDDIYDVQISEQEAQNVVNIYRKSNPKIVRLWDRLGRGFVQAVQAKAKRLKISDNGNPLICMGMIEVEGVPYAYIELPSGRCLYYARPKIAPTPRGPAVYYYGRDRYSGGWTHVHTYGGKLAENITQAVSRDILAEAMIRLRNGGWIINMTVHDEVVAQDRDDSMIETSVVGFNKLMTQVPSWAYGLPIEVDIFSSLRYRK